MVARFSTNARAHAAEDAASLPAYRLPAYVWLRISQAVLAGKPRSYARDARLVARHIPGSMQISGAEHIPPQGACLLVCNHYTRPGLGAWIFTSGIATAIAAHRDAGSPADIHWIITESWRYADWRRHAVTPMTRWAFARIARVYDFVTMPPMPPAPEEMAARAVAVRRALRLAQRLAAEGGLMGLAPEGRDTPQTVGEAVPGAGDFIALLVGAGLMVLPVAASEPDGRLRLNFGAPFAPEIPRRRADRDRIVTAQVMDTLTQLAQES